MLSALSAMISWGEVARAAATRVATSEMSTGASSVSMKRLSGGIVAAVSGLKRWPSDIFSPRLRSCRQC